VAIRYSVLQNEPFEACLVQVHRHHYDPAIPDLDVEEKLLSGGNNSPVFDFFTICHLQFVEFNGRDNQT
jgi:hypothetical protein